MTPDRSAPAITLRAGDVAAPAERARPAVALLYVHGALLLVLLAALGWIADHWGLMASMWISALIPLAGRAITPFLPEPRGR
jgi:hypothetical protein